MFSRNFRKKHSNIKFHENPSSGSRALPCGRSDVRTEGQMDRGTDEGKREEYNGRFSQFCDRV